MFQNLFSPSPLVWTGLIAGLVALPVLIHLINMLRHKRVKWAAMEFLMQSYKRQRNWIWLKQLLLLLTRIAIFLLALFTLANIGCENQYAAGFLGGRTTHHYVLVDDSYSMSDRSSNDSVFGHARRTVQTIAARASNRQNQRITVLRFSSVTSQTFDVTADAQSLTANQVSKMEDGLATIADVNGAQIDSALLETLQDRRAEWEVTQLSVSAMSAVSLVRQLVSQRNTEEAEVHILSDFRAKDWDQATELIRQIEAFPMETRVHFIRCAEAERPNSAITLLTPVRNTRAAGVPLFCDVAVRNFGDSPINNIGVEISSRLYEDIDGTGLQGQDLASIKFEEVPLPPVFFEEIKPGETATQRFSVYFAKPGRHVIRAKLPDDSVMVDNVRQTVVQTEESSSVLLVDDSAAQHAYYVASAFEPGGNRKTGVSSQIVTPDFLRTVDQSELQQFTAIYLLDIQRLDEDVRRKLTTYVSGGGGLAFFVGTKTDVAHYNDLLYRRGEGLFPVPMQRTYTLPEENATGTADILPEDHPVFEPFNQTGGTLLDLVQIETIMRPAAEWKATDQSQVRVAAWIRRKGEYPLMVEKSFGDGRVAAVLTTAAPIWHNWNKNPTFVVMLLELQDFLSAGRVKNQDIQLGGPVRVALNAKQFLATAIATVPIDDGESREQMDVEATQAENELIFQFGGTQPDRFNVTRAGIYELIATAASDGQSSELFRYAANVDPSEGNLRLATDETLVNRFSLVKPSVNNWSELNPDPHDTTATYLSKILLVVLIVLLVLEQLLAYGLSFHPKRSEQRQQTSDNRSNALDSNRSAA